MDLPTAYRAPAGEASPTGTGRVAFDETPTPIPTTIGPTQVPHPVWGKYNTAEIVFVLETKIVEL